MLLQRVKTKSFSEESVSWYPFQLGYVLQIIPDIVDKNSEYHDAVDLLWFPTGGGKTEAYLGVSAFTIFYRRLNDEDADGVTVLMRYTLRLLTIQQFERATALICACEYLRRKHKLGGYEISIGLWIGSNMTPNRLEDAKVKIIELRDDPDKRITDGNPMQIHRCPWCGSEIDIGCYQVGQTMTIKCRNNNGCQFHDGLPIYVIDEDIYEKCPTLLLSTVDKFARIVWEEKAGRIFGQNKRLSPELIIQDELHLISGPLGSLTGVYEVMVEYLCEQSGNKPKIIASTATVKKADEQIKGLYNRKMVQFPPNGISCKDSFFAVTSDENQRPARTYIGLCEAGGSLADLLIRIYASLVYLKVLFIKQNINSDVIDQFYTTVGYFNAIKDLGSSSSILTDRVYTYAKSLLMLKFKDEAENYNLELKDIKSYIRFDELTSRKTSKEIKETLEKLSIPYTDDRCYGYVLASNMLSVGINIDRLGIMTVYNQPKTTSEYIQATSRVGRSNPGLVLTMYNNMRSRDKSHYEQFCYYHKTFYKNVEATSVTPYSMRSIEKALHGIFVGMVRHSIPEMRRNQDAANFSAHMPQVSRIKEFILKQINDIYPQAFEIASEYLDFICDEWHELAKKNKSLVYFDKTSICLLHAAEEDIESDFPSVLNSLRNVDPSSKIYIKTRERV